MNGLSYRKSMLHAIVALKGFPCGCKEGFYRREHPDIVQQVGHGNGTQEHLPGVDLTLAPRFEGGVPSLAVRNKIREVGHQHLIISSQHYTYRYRFAMPQASQKVSHLQQGRCKVVTSQEGCKVLQSTSQRVEGSSSRSDRGKKVGCSSLVPTYFPDGSMAILYVIKWLSPYHSSPRAQIHSMLRFSRGGG